MDSFLIFYNQGKSDTGRISLLFQIFNWMILFGHITV